MSRSHALLALLVLVAAGLLAPRLMASEEQVRLFDRQIASVQSSSSFVDVSAADYTSYVTLLTIEPDDDHALYDTAITIALDQGSGGANSFAAGYTTETVQFAVARKIQGTWFVDDELETATVAGNAADDRCVTLKPGLIGPTEDCRIYVKLSAEQTDAEFPYVVSYRSGASATFTDVSN